VISVPAPPPGWNPKDVVPQSQQQAPGQSGDACGPTWTGVSITYFLTACVCPRTNRARNRQRHAVGQDDKHHIPWHWIGEMSAPSTILEVVE
jgi:hypothetical protein